MRYPIVLIHGLFGYGHEDEVKNSDLLPYWGYKGNNLIEHLQSEGYEVHYPSLGPYNSAWDRACILWAYLFGGRVDYGKVHSARVHHERYGATYPGALKDLGQSEKHMKIDLFGHSLGGATVKEVSNLFTQGSKEERDGTAADDLSPLFAGGHGDLIHTVTTLSGVNNGTMAATLTDRTGISIATIFGIMFNDTINGNGDYENKLDQWTGGAIAKATKYSLSLDDDVSKEMDIDFVQKHINPKQVVNKGTYYFAQRAFEPTFEMSGACRYCGTIMAISGNAAGLKYHPDFMSWYRNDGFVNLAGQSAPFDARYKDGYWSGTKFRPGIWYNMPPKIEDHIYWCGHSGCIQDLYADFDRMLSLYDKLK